MIVPDLITPIDFDKNTNEFIFILENYILRINYEDKLFELQTPNQLAYNESFEFIKSPPEWFDTIIDFGLVEWIRKAIAWNKTKSQPQDITKPFSFKVEGIIYTGTFNPRTNELSLSIPSKTIICRRDSITTDFPEIQFIENGELITKVTDIIIDKIKSGSSKKDLDYPPSLPLVFRPETIIAGYRMFDFDYNVELDLALLMIPDREIQANLLTIETDARELAELHQGMLCDVIRSVVYEKSISE